VDSPFRCGRATLPQPAAVEPALPEDEPVEAGEDDDEDEEEDEEEDDVEDGEESFDLEPPSLEALWAALAAWRLSVR
jgi:hypothetical protein